MPSRRRRYAAAAVITAGAAGTAGWALMRQRRSSTRTLRRRTGVSAGGMEFSVVGDGPRTLLVIPGGPGSEIPSGAVARLMESGLRKYLDAGYSVWTATRPRGMPSGHSAADMADDYARLIGEEMGGSVDVVLGQSFGGMISICLAAHHPVVLRRLVVAGAAAEVSRWGAEIDGRLAALQAEGRYAEAGAVLLESIVASQRFARFRGAAGAAIGAILAKTETPGSDLIVEANAVAAFDAWEELAVIRCPVLLVAGEADRFFPLPVVQQTAAGIRGATVVTYADRGHAGLFADGRLPSDVVAWLREHHAAG